MGTRKALRKTNIISRDNPFHPTGEVGGGGGGDLSDNPSCFILTTL